MSAFSLEHGHTRCWCRGGALQTRSPCPQPRGDVLPAETPLLLPVTRGQAAVLPAAVTSKTPLPDLIVSVLPSP